MAEAEHDDLADALARMAGGDVAPSEQTPPAPVEPAPKPVLRPAAIKPVAARPMAPTPKLPAAQLPQQPAAPRAARPAAPVLGSPTPPSPRVPRPIAPALTSTPGAAKRERPSAPTIRQPTMAPTDAEADGGQSTGLTAEAAGSEIVDDDDSVIVPAPEASVFVPKSKTSAEVRARIAKKKNLEFRRTLIPILLTCGVMMLAFAGLRFVTGPDSMLSNLPIWIPIALVSAGFILLALAVVNMLGVKAQLDAEAKQLV
jgi:hypothetical protein